MGSIRSWSPITLVALSPRHAGSAAERQTLHYHGIRASEGCDGFDNPERGFLLESRIAESSDRTRVLQTTQLQQHGVPPVQTYCCLCNCVILLGESSSLEAKK
jgi:hypothetical protein